MKANPLVWLGLAVLPAVGAVAQEPSSAEILRRAIVTPAAAEVSSKDSAREAESKRLGERLINAKAKLATAEEAYDEIKRQAEKQKASPHPDIARAIRRARLALEAAEKEAGAGDTGQAERSLTISTASADEVLRAAGAL